MSRRENLVTRLNQSEKMSPCGPAKRLKARRDWRGTPLGMSLEMESELEQSRHEIVVCFAVVNCFAVAVAGSSRP